MVIRSYARAISRAPMATKGREALHYLGILLVSDNSRRRQARRHLDDYDGGMAGSFHTLSSSIRVFESVVLLCQSSRVKTRIVLGIAATESFRSDVSRDPSQGNLGRNFNNNRPIIIADNSTPSRCQKFCQPPSLGAQRSIAYAVSPSNYKSFAEKSIQSSNLI